MNFAQELNDMYTSKRAERLENREEIMERRSREIKLFFEKEVLENAKTRMKERAEKGKPTANILEYSQNERFYVDGDMIVRFVDMEVDRPNYRIHNVVMKDPVFAKLLNDFENEISTDEVPIKFTKWRPRDNLRVIEAVWGKNRYHRTNNSMTKKPSYKSYKTATITKN
ncbi:MAG: hypothetical protein ACO3UU_12330 [Minisyncoccia bacterium]|jgi:hypothetical protein